MLQQRTHSLVSQWTEASSFRASFRVSFSLLGTSVSARGGLGAH